MFPLLPCDSKCPLMQKLLIHSLPVILTGTINHTRKNIGWRKQKTKIPHPLSTLAEFVPLLNILVICFREYSLWKRCTTNSLFVNHSKVGFLHVLYPHTNYPLLSCDFSLITKLHFVRVEIMVIIKGNISFSRYKPSPISFKFSWPKQRSSSDREK